MSRCEGVRVLTEDRRAGSANAHTGGEKSRTRLSPACERSEATAVVRINVTLTANP
jgi:hypothetical protein